MSQSQTQHYQNKEHLQQIRKRLITSGINYSNYKCILTRNALRGRIKLWQTLTDKTTDKMTDRLDVTDRQTAARKIFIQTFIKLSLWFFTALRDIIYSLLAGEGRYVQTFSKI